MMHDDDSTHFGYQTVKASKKAEKVAEVFHSVAANYDLMNDVMSMGLHRGWKRFAVDLCALQPGHFVLDLAAGTGDLTKRIAERVGVSGQVVSSDINDSMLEQGRARLLDEGVMGNLSFVLADASILPFASDSFDCVTISFGLRNVTDKQRALEEMQRVLKPGGCLVILEFSKITLPALRPLYDAYSFNVLPALGKLFAKDAESYRYLAESIRMHPDQSTLKNMMETAGFSRCDVHNLAVGVVAVHRGYKL